MEGAKEETVAIEEPKLAKLLLHFASSHRSN